MPGKMLPNLVSAVRVPLAFCVFLLLCLDLQQWNEVLAEPVCRMLALAVLIGAWLTDAIDGWAARSKYGEVSDFGKIFDPICDSILHLVVFFAFWLQGWMPASLLVWAFLPREVLSYIYRYAMGRHGKDLGARQSGKWKTRCYATAQIATVAVYAISPYAGLPDGVAVVISRPILVIAAGVAIWSGVDYARHGYRSIYGD